MIKSRLAIGSAGFFYAYSNLNLTQVITSFGDFYPPSSIKIISRRFFVDRLAAVATVKYKARQLVVIKPATYMNLSGKAVKYWLDKEKIDVSNMLVVVDDIALDIGQLRMKTKGGDAGHNGLTDIIIKLNTTSFPRLRFGIGNNFPRGYQSDYVLGKWSNKEIDLMLPRVDIATDIIKSFVSIGPQLTMTNYNNK